VTKWLGNKPDMRDGSSVPGYQKQTQIASWEPSRTQKMSISAVTENKGDLHNR
jgi:hypothetical protein